jgi:TRAP-type mannitol/chloroaromatic compound transport system permease large subunit
MKTIRTIRLALAVAVLSVGYILGLVSGIVVLALVAIGLCIAPDVEARS